MSETLNTREYRKKFIKEIILELHSGKEVAEVKSKFDEIIKDMDAPELAAIEQELINEGLPVDEVRRLCDVHLAVFKDSLNRTSEPIQEPGHPIYTFKAENVAIAKLIDEEIKPLLLEISSSSEAKEDVVLKLREKINLLADVDKHYSRKENLLFPFLEKYQVTGPSKIMWAADDEIRGDLKTVKVMLKTYQEKIKPELIAKVEETLKKITDMFIKEEKVLFLTALKFLTEDEWRQIMEDSDEIGYCLIDPEKGWRLPTSNALDAVDKAQTGKDGYIKFPTGILTSEEISLIFNHLPVDITFVDKEGIVKYFSQGKERIFARTRTIIGRTVDNCHPPASVHVVEKLVEELKSGKKDHEDFWLPLGDKYVLIRYFAVRDARGEFLGVVEVSQNIKPIQAITGEKRIMD